MATPLGHGLVGVGAYAATRSKERWCLIEAAISGVLAAMPDLDMIVSALVSGKVGTFHRGFTHRPAFALIVASVILTLGSLVKRSVGWGLVAWSAFAGFLVATHRVLDCWIRLPYRRHEWDGESSLPEVVAAQKREADVSNYLIDLLVYGLGSLLVIISLGLIRRKLKRP